MLEGRPHEDDVGQQVVREEALGDPLRADEDGALESGAVGDRLLQGIEVGPTRIGLEHPRRGRDGRVHHGQGPARIHPVEVTLRRGLQDVARQVQIGAGGAHDGRGHGLPLPRHAQVGHDRTRLLREPRLVQPADGQPERFGGPLHDPGRGDHTRPADAREVDAVPPVAHRGNGGRREVARRQRRRPPAARAGRPVAPGSGAGASAPPASP